MLAGHRLCERGAARLEETGLASWRAAGAARVLEWVQGIRTVTAAWTPYAVRESLHPNLFGQRALRACLRRAWNAGRPRGTRCPGT